MTQLINSSVLTAIVGRRFQSYVAFTVLATVLVGCGGGSGADAELGTVTGQVTLNGQPLPQAEVQFVPLKGGRSSYGTTDDNGMYELVYSASAMGAVIGSHEVRISGGETANLDAAADADLIDTGVLAVPPRFSDESELRFDVEPGQNIYDIDVAFSTDE